MLPKWIFVHQTQTTHSGKHHPDANSIENQAVYFQPDSLFIANCDSLYNGWQQNILSSIGKRKGTSPC